MLSSRVFQVVVWCGVIVLALVISVYAVLSGVVGPRILNASPSDGDHDVPITSVFGIEFSAPMEQKGVEERFQIEPQLDGNLAWDGKVLTFEPRTAFRPATTYSVTLEAGSVSQGGAELDSDHLWRFQTRAPQLLYLARKEPEAENRQIFVSARPGESRMLTDHPLGVWDYAAHPLGEEIVYSVLRDDGGADLWRADRDGEAQSLLLACPGSACINPAWSPDGSKFAFEKRDIWASAPNLDPKAGRIWIYERASGLEQPLFEYDVPAHSPVWSPTGERLAYASPLLPGIEVYDLESQKLESLGSEWGSAPQWAPDGSELVMPELFSVGESIVVRLLRLELATQDVTILSGEEDLVKDVAPAWSPAGGWIAFSRQYLDPDQWTPGRQLWLTRPDGSEAYQLVERPLSDLFGATWRPDAGALAYLSTDLSQGPQPKPEVSIWVFDFQDGGPVQVVDDGVLPMWLP